MRTTRLGMLVLGAAVVLAGCETAGPTTPRDADVVSAGPAAEAYMGRADAYLGQGLTDAALAAFGLALEENPDITQAHIGMGHIYRERGQYPMAERAYQRAVDTDPNNFDAHYYLALMKQLMGNVREAIAVYLQALAIRPDDFQANRDLAAAYLQTGRPGQALPYAKKATEAGESAEAWSNLAAAHSLLGQYEEAVQAYRQALEEMGAGDAAEPVLLGLADANIKLGRHERAINVLDQLIARSPSSTAYERMGFALFKMGRYDEALGKFRQALSLDPSDTSALNGVGVALMTQYIEGGRNDARLRDQAIDAWRRSVQIRPDQSRIVDLLSRYRRL